MKNSNLLKSICYVVTPIIILVLFMSILYEIFQMNTFDYNYYNDSDINYFETDDFLSNYMSIVYTSTYNLIRNNDSYNSILDNNKTRICYYYDKVTNNDLNIKDFYYLIIYKDLALTNVELTTNTNSIEKIKEYIESTNGKKANIINGRVEADSELINTKAIQYFDNFTIKYYTITENETTSYFDQVEDVITENSTESERKYYTTSIEDFQIYTAYDEDIIQADDEILNEKIIETLEPYSFIAIPAIPICSIAILMILIYLIISIGHTKGKDGIDLNDLDKIPIEILIGILLIIIAIFTCTFATIISSTSSTEILASFNLIISIFLALYFVTYISCIMTFVTLVKRIKAKTLINTSICGRLLKWSFKITKKTLKRINRFLKTIVKSWNTAVKVFVFVIGFILIIFFFPAAFKKFGVLVDAILVSILIIKAIQKINCYKKIEDYLKKMYEGNKIDNLSDFDFTPEFKDTVKYLNDISNGFENAKQEGIKSERMKTELITNVSHDIKTPLTSIINYVDLLKKEDIKNKKAKEYIDILDGKSQRLKKLTEDLVEASKASSGAVKLNIEKINIVELIKQTIGEFEDRFEDKKLEIIPTMPKEEIYINVDSKYMYRIIENLFSNISKYALESSRVYIDVRSSGLKVNISIKNISKEKLNISAEELMQRFVRGDKSRTTEGSGLGLSISQSLTELQKGTFSLNVDGDLFKVELEFDIAK